MNKKPLCPDVEALLDALAQADEEEMNVPNNDLISKRELRKTFAEYCPGDCSSCDYCSATVGKLFCALIDDSPVIDAEPVRHGNWEIINRNEAQCTKCKMIRNISNQTGWNYCPKCGAKMDLEVQHGQK